MTSTASLSRRRRRAAGALATGAALAALCAAAPAHADSIAYVKGGDLWLSTSDGQRQYQVTSDGGYSTVSQSDGGTLVALHGDRIRTVDRTTGAVKFDVLTPASSSFPGTPFRGPFDPAVSPDASRVAYTWYYTQYGETPSCNPSTGCQTVYGRQGTGFTALDHQTGFDDPGFQSQSGWVSPSWLSNSAVISSDPIQVGNPQAAFLSPGDAYSGGGIPGATQPWFNDGNARGLRDIERDRANTKFAAVTGDANEGINFYRSTGDYPHIPEACFGLTGAQGRYQQPSWKPDGSRVAFADDRGISTIAIPDMTRDCGTPTETESTVLIPGAAYPDWGPAEVPPARPTPVVDPPPGPGTTTTTPGTTPTTPGTPPGGTPPTPTTPRVPTTTTTTTPDGSGGSGASGGSTLAPAAGGTITLRRTSLRTLLNRGIVVRASGLARGRHTLTLRLGRRAVGTGKLTVGASGTGSTTVRVTKAGRRVLAGRRTAKLTLSGAGLSVTTTVKR